MKKVGLLLMLIGMISMGFAQKEKDYSSTYASTDGKVHFFSSTPMENIEATSNVGVCVLDTKTKKVYSKVAMTTMKFPKKLMEEHFNENYIESEKYPYAILDAVIVEDLDYSKDTVYTVTLRGTFEVHGVKKSRDIQGKLTVKGGVPVNAKAEFMVPLADHDIKVPSVVAVNIAESIKVDVDFNFVKFQKK